MSKIAKERQKANEISAKDLENTFFVPMNRMVSVPTISINFVLATRYYDY